MTAQDYLDSLNKAVVDAEKELEAVWKNVTKAEVNLQLRQAARDAAQQIEMLRKGLVAEDEPEWREATADDIGQACRVILPDVEGWVYGTLANADPGKERPYIVRLKRAPGSSRFVAICQVQKKG
jgi:hypothetical protein